MEEVKNNLLERIKGIENGEKYIKILDICGKDVLERLLFVKNDKNLRLILNNFLDINDLGVDINDELLLIIIDIINKKGKIDSLYGNIIYGELQFKDKLECLNGMLKAKTRYQEENIYYLYAEDNLYRDLAINLILTSTCKIQADEIYNVFHRCKEGNEYNPTFIEVAKLMTKVVDKEILFRMEEILDNKNLLESGCVTVVANLITKCKNYDQLIYIASIFDDTNKKVDMEHIPYAMEACQYFLLTKDKTSLKNLYDYICYALSNKLPISLDNVNLIINARHKFNGKYATEALTNDALVRDKEETTVAGILSDSRKEYQAFLIKNNLHGLTPELFVGASMLVNEAETRKKALTITAILNSLVKYEEINENSLVFASLINRVYTDVEINLIADLAKNTILNKIGVALPLARIIALEEEENDRLIIWNAYQNEETAKSLIFGLVSLNSCTISDDRDKAKKIINNILKEIDIPFDFEKKEGEVLKRR